MYTKCKVRWNAISESIDDIEDEHTRDIVLFKSQNYKELKKICQENGTLFVDYEFPNFLPSSVFEGRPTLASKVKWKRPKELVSEPVFVHGLSRNDLTQGCLGDCWFIAALADLTMKHQLLFKKVVIPGQDFTDQNYTGMFRFRFWKDGYWCEVVVDDRLPTLNGEPLFLKNSNEKEEFWPALIEKAYAKFKGGYNEINGGHIEEGICDLTGGISEKITLGDIPESMDLYGTIEKTLLMNSLLGCYIKANPKSLESKTSDGLYKGHAYSVTGLATVKTDDGCEEELIRIRNPWGRCEWSGAWSDYPNPSKEWSKVTVDVKERLQFQNLNEGEFWMPFKQWMVNFSSCVFCHLTPDALTKEIADNEDKSSWNMVSYHGEWIPGVNAGGCGNDPYARLKWINPQYLFTLDKEQRHKDGKCTVIVSLTQISKKNTKIPIGFSIYKLYEKISYPVDEDNYTKYVKREAASSDRYVYDTEICERFEFSAGHYIVMPSTYQPKVAGKFLLRIFTEKETKDSRDISIHIFGNNSRDKADIRPTIPVEPPEDEENTILHDYFNKYKGGDEEMDAYELLTLLNDIYSKEENVTFGIESARSLLSMMDQDHSGQLKFNEFKSMMAEIDTWKDQFHRFDENKSGSIDVHEIQKIFKNIGFNVSQDIFAHIVRRYGSRNNEITFDSFLVAVTKLVYLYNSFVRYSKRGLTGTGEIDIHDWLLEGFYS